MTQLTGKVHQIGAGGIGFWMAVALARSRVDLTVYDYDNLVGGLGWSRLPKPSNPEIKKVSFLRGFCLAVMGDQAPKIVDGYFDTMVVKEGDLVVDCSDMDLESRRPYWEACKVRGARILRVSYDGRNNTVVVAEGLPLAGRVGGGYAEAPSLALSFTAGGIGALVVQRILAGYSEHIEFQITLEDYFKSPDEEFMKAVEEADDELVVGNFVSFPKTFHVPSPGNGQVVEISKGVVDVKHNLDGKIYRFYPEQLTRVFLPRKEADVQTQTS